MLKNELIKPFENFPEHWKECVYAMVCAPRTNRNVLETRSILNLMKHYGIRSPEESQEFEATLEASQWVMLPWMHSDKWSAPYLDLLPKLYVDVLPHVTVDVLERQGVLRLIEQPPASPATNDYQISKGTWGRFLAASVANDRFHLRDEELSSEGFLQILQDFLCLMAREKFFTPFLKTLPNRVKDRVFARIMNDWTSMWYLDDVLPRIRESLGMTKEDLLRRGRLPVGLHRPVSRLGLYDFLKEGHPKEQMRLTARGSKEFHLLKCVVAMGSENYGDAVEYAREALGSARYFDDEVYNWILGLAYYLNRQDGRTIQYVERDAKHWRDHATDSLLFFHALMKLEEDETAGEALYLIDPDKTPRFMDVILRNVTLLNEHVFDLDEAHVKRFYEDLQPIVKRFPVFAQILELAVHPESAKALEYEKAWP